MIRLFTFTLAIHAKSDYNTYLISNSSQFEQIITVFVSYITVLYVSFKVYRSVYIMKQNTANLTSGTILQT